MSNRISLSTMPDGTAVLFLIQLVSILSFGVLYSSLVLYIKDKLGLPASSANSIAGIFIAFSYSLHLLGGVLTGRLFSNRSLFCIGMLAQIIGCFILSYERIDFLYAGLSVFLTGSGLNVTCLNCMLTQKFTPNDTRRETAFLWSYALMNIGFFIGFSLSGMFQISQNYQELFLLACIGNVLALILCLFYWKKLDDEDTPYAIKSKAAKRKSIFLGITVVLSLPFVLYQTMHYSYWSSQIVMILGLVMLFTILFIASQQSTKDAQNKLYAFAALVFMSTIFWTLYQTGPMGLTFFIEHNVDRHYFNGYIPPQWFQNINTLTIVLGGPLLGTILNKMRAKGIQVNIPSQFSLSLLCIGLAFVILPISIYYSNADGLANPAWIVACYVLQSIGELLISPIGYAMIGFLAPTSLQGTMMGMWMLAAGVAATLSSYSSNLMLHGQDNMSPLITNSSYSEVFLFLGLSALVASLVFFALAPVLKRLMNREEYNIPTEVALCE